MIKSSCKECSNNVFQWNYKYAQAFHWDTSFIKREEKNQLEYFIKYYPQKDENCVAIEPNHVNSTHWRTQIKVYITVSVLFPFAFSIRSCFLLLFICSTCRGNEIGSRYKEFHMRRNFHFLSFYNLKKYQLNRTVQIRMEVWSKQIKTWFIGM